MNQKDWCVSAFGVCSVLVVATLVVLQTHIPEPRSLSNEQRFYTHTTMLLGIPPYTPRVDNVTVSHIEITPRLQFLGDILLGRNVERLMQKNGSDYSFRHMPSIVAGSAFVFANFEASVPSVHVPTPDMVTKFSVATTALQLLRTAGVTHVTLANNHAYDYGRAGFKSTVQSLAAADIISFGNPDVVSTTSVTYVHLGGYLVAVIGLHAVVTNPSDAELESVMEQARAESDMQIAYVHWGDEYQTLHSKRQEYFARQLVALGVDAVIGHHPHVVQDIQLIDGVPVFYSLGNFIFDQYFSFAVQTALSVTLQYDGSTLTFSLLPLSSLAMRSQPQLLEGVPRTDFLDILATHSDVRLSQNIKQGKVIVPFILATSSKTRIISE